MTEETAQIVSEIDMDMLRQVHNDYVDDGVEVDEHLVSLLTLYSVINMIGVGIAGSTEEEPYRGEDAFSDAVTVFVGIAAAWKDKGFPPQAIEQILDQFSPQHREMMSEVIEKAMASLASDKTTEKDEPRDDDLSQS